MDKKMAVIILQKGLTQKEIAEMVGVHQPKVSEWLRGVRMPNSKFLFKLADVLKEDPSILATKLKHMSELE